MRAVGNLMAIRDLAARLLTFFWFALGSAGPDSASRRFGSSADHSPHASLAKEARALRKEASVAIDPDDWPMYNRDVLGWRHNPNETALNKSDVARLEEKW